MATDFSKAPYYDTIKAELDKDYKQILFTSGKAVQNRELTGIGSYARESTKQIANLVYKGGPIISGCAIQNIDVFAKTVTMTTGKVFVDGEVYDIVFERPTGPFGENMPANPDIVSKTIPIKTEGKETIFVEIITKVIDSAYDPELLDPAEGFDNYMEPGASRLKKVARYISTSHPDYNAPGYIDNPRIAIYDLYDGGIKQDIISNAKENVSENKPTPNVDIIDVLAQRSYETSGNYLVEGYGVKVIDCPDSTKIGFLVEPGVAYINGFRRELTEGKKIFIEKNSLKHLNVYEDKSIDNSVTEYKLNNTPVIDAVVSAPIKNSQQLIYNAGTRNLITPPMGYSVYRVLKVYMAGATETVFTEGSDYNVSGNELVWLSTGNHPVSSFIVDYTYKATLEPSKYSILYKGTYSITQKIPVNDLGYAEIPKQHLNPSVISIYDSARPNVELQKGRMWYQQGNRIKIATIKSPDLPMEIVKSNSRFDPINIVDGVVENVSYYSEIGETHYTKKDVAHPENFDYSYNVAARSIEWKEEKVNCPPVGETFIANVTVPVNAANNSITSVTVHFSYEASYDLHTNKVYDSYIKFVPGTVYGSDANDTISIESTVARARKDSICLDANGNIIVIHGTILSTNGIYETRVPDNVLKLADALIKPTSARNVAMFQSDNYRMRMKDLREMFSKVKDIEYNLSLTMLEEYAQGLATSSTLRGILTDGFLNLQMSDNSAAFNFVNSADSIAVPNIAEAKLYPGFKRHSGIITPNLSNSTAKKKNSTYVLSDIETGSAEILWKRQPYATTIRSLCEGVWDAMIFPKIDITPDSDYFIAGASELVGEDGDYLVIPTVFNTYDFVGSRKTSLAGDVSAGAFTSKAITIQMWYFADKTTSNPAIFSTNSNLSVRIINDTSLCLYNNSSIVSTVTAGNLFGRWVHLAVVIPANDLVSGIKVYVDGSLCRKSNTTTTFPLHSATKFNFGGMFNGTNSANYLNGGMADIRICDRELSEDEIKTYIIAELPIDSANLVGYYYEPITAAYLFNSAIDAKIGNLVRTSSVTPGGIDAGQTDIARMTEYNPFIQNTHIINTIDITQGNVRPQDTSSTSLTGSTTSIVGRTTSSSSTSTSSTGGKYYVYNNPNSSLPNGYQDTTTTTTNRTTTTTTTQTTNTYRVDKTWYTRETETQVQDYGTFLSEIEPALTLRRRKITVHGRGMLPNTDPITVTFDGEVVSLFAVNGGKGQKSSTTGCWKTDENGEFDAAFIIPDRVPVGVREVEMTIPGGYSSKTLYWGAGNVVEKTNLTVQQDTIYWKENKSTSTYSTTSTNTSSSTSTSTSTSSSARHVCSGTIPLAQTFYVNAPGLTGSIIDDIADFTDVTVSSIDFFPRTFKATTEFVVGFAKLTDSGIPAGNLSTWVGEPVIVKGTQISENGGKFEYGTAKHNVKFNTPVHLRGGEGYALLIGSSDQDARVWVAKIGETEPTINNVAGKKVSSEPDRGVLLSSPNGRTWATYIEEDLKYNMYIKDFFLNNNLENVDPSLALVKTNNMGKSAIVEYDEINFNTHSSGKIQTPNFFKFDVLFSNSLDKTGYVKFEYSAKMNGVYGNWTEFTPGMLINFDLPTVAVKVRAKLITFSRFSSPSINEEAAITYGEYVIPANYVSKTVQSGRYNRFDAYIDKFLDEEFSDVIFKVSPDGGYTWIEPEIDSLEPIEQFNNVYNGKPQYQYCLKGELVLDKPKITNLVMENVPSGETVVEFMVGNTYEIAYCLKDIYDREGPLSDPKTFTAVANKSPKVTVEFNPNATGYSIYTRNVTLNEPFKLWYDSTITSKLKTAMTLSDNVIKIGSEGRLFPRKGIVLIDGEYLKYNGRDKIDDNNYNLVNVLRGQSNMGLPSLSEAHIKDTNVILADACVLNRGAPTNIMTDLWKFPNFNIVKDTTTNELRFTFDEFVVDKGLDTDLDDNPLYESSYPASYESENVTFRIVLSNKNQGSTVGRQDLIPTVGRVIINTSYEAY